MGYADDVVFMGRKLQDVEEVFTSLVEQTNETGLGKMKNKTFNIVSWKPCSENENVTLSTYNFQIVKDYTYIGKF